MWCPNCETEQAALYECEDLFLCNECLCLLDKITGEIFRMKAINNQAEAEQE